MNRIKEIHVRIIGIPVLGVLLSFLFCDGLPDLTAIAKTTTFTFVFWQGLFMILTHLRNRYPHIQQTNKRLLYTTLAGSTFLITFDVLLRVVFDYFLPEHVFTISNMWVHSGQNLFIAFIIVLIYESYYFYGRWNQSNLETEKLRTQQIFSQLEALKSQISPHFLFNSLNTLVALISENQQQAIEFTQKLSEVYRYILQYKDKELVKLSTELEFIKSYVFLLKMRF